MNNWNNIFFVEAVNKVNERKLLFEEKDIKRRYDSKK